MAKVEEVEYETVEKKVEKYQCDHCDSIVDDSEMHTVAFIEGTPRSTARVGDNSVETQHWCEGCVGLKEAIEIRETKDYLRTRWNAITRGAIEAWFWIGPIAGTVVGVVGMLVTGIIGPADDPEAYYLLDPFFGFLIAIAMFIIWTFIVWKIAKRNQ